MRNLATIQKITNLEPIKDKDKIELATILGWKVIVGKGEYKVGDLVVYCEYDTVLPQRPEFEFLRKRCFVPKWDGFRIRNMKMSNVYSMGIVFNLDILPEKIKIKEHLDVTDVLGIKKYDPEALLEKNGNIKRSPLMKYLLKFRFFRMIRRLFVDKSKGHNYPMDISKSSEDNIQVKFGKLKNECPNELYYLTEKMEGQSFTAEYRHNKKMFSKDIFKVYSHNIQRKTPDGSNWWTIANNLNIKEKLSDINYDVSIQGEICGNSIQKNIYEFNELKLFIFRVKNLTTGQYFEFDELVNFCATNNFEMVPVIETNRKLSETVNELLNESNGITIHNDVRKNQLREGIVWRSINSQEIGFKVKSPKYLMWWDSKNK